MLARRLTTILPAMTLAEAIETTRIHRVAVRTGDRTALVTTRPIRAPHHTISDVGLIGGGHVLMPSDVSRPITACCAWMSSPRADAMSSRSCASCSRRVFSTDNLPHLLNLHTLAEIARRMIPLRDSWTAR